MSEYFGQRGANVPTTENYFRRNPETTGALVALVALAALSPDPLKPHGDHRSNQEDSDIPNKDKNEATPDQNLYLPFDGPKANEPSSTGNTAIPVNPKNNYTLITGATKTSVRPTATNHTPRKHRK